MNSTYYYVGIRITSQRWGILTRGWQGADNEEPNLFVNVNS